MRRLFGQASIRSSLTSMSVAYLEITLLEVLAGQAGRHFGSAGRMDLAVSADDRAGLVDQDRGVEAAPRAVLDDKLRVARVEADTEPRGGTEQRPRR